MTKNANTELPTVTGAVHQPGDSGYEAEISGFQTGYTHRPALVITAAHAEDVRAAVEYAARQGLPVAVQATGHGLSVAADGGVLINTRRMTDIRIDAATRTARVGAGVQAGQLIEAAAAHGLAPLNGSSNSVGVVGYTLGGGTGLMAREFGYAADHVRAIEMVTADGRARRLEPGDELFGAVLGTGGNFGIVTALELELVPVTTVYGGQLQFDGPLVPQALEAWRLWTTHLPEQLTSNIGWMTMPNIPQFPERLRGRFLATVNITYTGSQAEGERLVAPLRAVGELFADTLKLMPYTDSHVIYNDPPHPHPYTSTNALLDELPADVTDAFLEATGPESALPVVAGVRHMGGALGRPGPAGIAVDHRGAEYVARAIALPGPDAATVTDGLERIRKTVAPWTIGQNLNFLYGGGDQADEAQTRGFYTGATYDRLAALKSKYDAQNLFRFNRNILPR
ncbi:FAD-binding protein [Nocardia sp. SYP-A9097]|uniref:FAD-binding oxidoreductase n=1 Tax=Nocardia sp. SYP-A9097 TaxID=2663237 RepID=UPI00129B9906|nr:FAD-binding oxidoreductase [Nocardia sp. SYP-A9097]MRH89937.1 FAD-binding protein [Nocardia sp. SYP-A9097]